MAWVMYDAGHHLAASVFVLPLPLMLAPWFLARRLLAPLGWVKPSYYLAHTSFLMWGGDTAGAARTAAALAYHSNPRGAPKLRAWIERHLDSGRFGPGSVLAAAIMENAEGRATEARRLFTSLLEIDPAARTGATTRICGEWLVADAAEEGRWEKALELGARINDQNFTVRFLLAVASRLCARTDAKVEAADPSDLDLEALWWLAGRRSSLRPLLARALEFQRSPPQGARASPEDTPAVDPDDLQAHAVSLLIESTRRPAGSLTIDDLGELIELWERTLTDEGWQQRTLQRALALGAHNPRNVSERWRAQIEEDLVALVRREGIAFHRLRGDGPLLRATRRRLHDRMLGALEIAAQALDSRSDAAANPLPPLEEWKQWLGIVALYEEARSVGGAPVQRLGFRELHGAGCSLAVWLWNDRDEKLIGNAIFRYLLVEAAAAEDEKAMELLRRNVACGWE
jgi:hypothetical protein